MTRFAGIDIGNSTTEVVLVDGDVITADRVPTRGPKGGPASLDAAARLVRRLSGGKLDVVAVAPLRPVTTSTTTLPEPVVPTGRLRVAAAGSSTSGGPGVGVGKPFVVGTSPPAGSAVALVPAGHGYRSVVDELRELAAQGVLAAVVVERDEAVLLANRLPPGIPVVDEVPIAGLVDATCVAVEVRASLRALVDPLWMLGHLGLAADERPDAAKVAARLYDRTSAVVAVTTTAPIAHAPATATVILADGTSALLATHRPGQVTSYQLPDQPDQPVDDLFVVDLAALADAQLVRGGAVASRTVALAALRADAPYTDPGPELSELLGVEVHTVASESAAARIGALSTPGAPPDAVVVDIGGGTIDVVSAAGSTVLAGAGELLTTATAAVLGIARTPAEWAKRGPAARAEAPQLLLAEDGTRTFLDAPIRSDAIGSLVVPGPTGWLPFDRRLAPSEWRALRLRLKTDILGVNLARALAVDSSAELSYPGGLVSPPSAGVGRVGAPGTVLVVGGPAGDDEILGCVARALPPGTVVGRADTAGVLGHRHAVAYGLVLSLAARDR